jgi:hypothetical protein
MKITNSRKLQLEKEIVFLHCKHTQEMGRRKSTGGKKQVC